MDITVKNYRIKGHYYIQKNRFLYNFEKEVRATSPEQAVESVKQSFAAFKVLPSRIKIDKVVEVLDPALLKNRSVRFMAEKGL